MRSIAYSVICSTAIGYAFGVAFALRAIGMSRLDANLADAILLTGWVGLTFAFVFLPVGLIGLGFLSVVDFARRRQSSRETKIFVLAWLTLTTSIAVPFLGYFYSHGVLPEAVPGADSPWDLVPVWLIKVGRWIGFSVLTGALLALPARFLISTYFGLGRDVRSLWGKRMFIGIPLIVLATWMLPPTWIYLTRERAEPPMAAPVISPASPVAPIIVVGWDGATWDVIDPLLERGELPNLARLINTGSRAVLRTFRPNLSPLLWTTMSTGRHPSEHHIRSQVENRFRGMKRWFYFPPAMGFDRVFGEVWERIGIIDRVQVTSHARTRRAFWNILPENGQSVGLFNWRVAWPAERFTGYNVTNHLHPNLLRFVGDDEHIDPRLTDADLLNSMPGAVEPPMRRAFLDSCLTVTREITESLSQAYDLPLELVPAHEVFTTVVGTTLIDRNPQDLAGFYFYEIDGIEHRYWAYREPQYFFSVPDAKIHDHSHTIDAIYQVSDALLGMILDAAPENAIIMLVSDHGHGPVFGEFRRTGGHSSGPPGILVMSGPGVRQGATINDPDLYDVFPTLMYLSGLPVEQTAKGRVLLEALDPDIVSRRPVSFIENYPPLERSEAATTERQSPLKRELIKKLKSLGYL